MSKRVSSFPFAVLVSLLLLTLSSATVIASPASKQSDTVETVGELVRLESARALADARKASNNPEVIQLRPSTPQKITSVAVNMDLIELLGIVKRSGAYSADLAINGVVKKVTAGSRFGMYEVKAIGGNCLYLFDSGRKELLRCVAGAHN